MKRLIIPTMVWGVIGLALVMSHAEQNPTMIHNDIKAAASGNNAFAWDLYAKVASTKGNMFYSPSSLSTALAMCYGGARGSTAQEMAKVLHFSLEPKQLHPAVAQLAHLLTTPTKPGQYQLHIANALWVQKNFRLEADYVEQMKHHYGTGLQEVDYITQAEQARLTINEWVEAKTKNKIKDLIKPGMLTPDMRLVLTNAIYFLADWAQPFEKDATYPEDFLLTADRTMKASMMHQTSHMMYMENDLVQVLEKPYVGNDLSMVVILPKKRGGLSDLEAKINNEHYDQWIKQLKSARIALALPKFTMNTEYELSKVLPEMGMPLAFSDDADFSGMTKQESLKIGFVIHKAFVNVDEKGTEAAAATAVGMRLTAAAPADDPIVFKADHPFIVILRDKRSGTILFMGRVTEPKAAS